MANPQALALDERLKLLEKQTGGSIKVADLGRVVGDIVGSLSGGLQLTTVDVAQEIDELVRFIEQMRKEVEKLAPTEIAGQQIPHAHDQLEAVVRATEEATGVFLDSAEQLEQIADRLEEPFCEDVRTIVTRIYEASNFQDITGQRITKVVSTLAVIEQRLIGLAGLMGEQIVRSPLPMVEDVPLSTDEDLLNGPQLPETAANQDDIDRLFDSL